MDVARLTRDALRPFVAHHPRLKNWLIERGRGLDALRHAASVVVPTLVRPRTRNLTIAVTARCNLRCMGCRYGRDFMLAQQLPLEVVRDLLDDAADAGVETIRLYGGEPLLHEDLPAMVEHAVARGLSPYVTTNATLLERRIDDLFRAGLRTITVGFYGTDEAYDAYTGNARGFAQMERGVAAVRERHGDAVRLRLNWLLMRPTANNASLDAALDFARRYQAPIQIDLIHYSLPYFTEGPDRCLQFRPEDEATLRAIAERLLVVQREEPWLLEHSTIGLRAIPDWLLRGRDMRVPCDKYDMLWIGADGSVQLCYVTFPLGNLHRQRLSTILGSPEHVAAARAAFRLACPNCHCGYDSRTQKHLTSRWRYGR
ncbi:MAG: radical SAM protein [Planctomycetes bacterium]|nr:radical SAM protein [Planctomycetota bacterium]